MITVIGGDELVTRQMTGRDAAAVRELHERCSPETLYLRYLGPYPKISDAIIRRFTEKGTSLITEYGGAVVAMTNVMDTGEAGVQEVAFLIDDRWQGRGLGTRLLRHVLSTTMARELTATMSATNRRMAALMRGAGARLPRPQDQLIEARLRVQRRCEVSLKVLTSACPSAKYSTRDRHARSRCIR